ncbi:MAG: chitobiase/beta-hexosaminidase C-terminal domain-containing protein [Acidobacteriales bacterium]|nr:chitobiase/beta-hexosaminidase C-terminal domain-containing protein [Terriglobales bacterium]
MKRFPSLPNYFFDRCRGMSASAAILTAGLLMGAAILANAQDVSTYHNDVGRTGQNLNETLLTTSNVNSTSFGRLFTLATDGKVDAQPLYVSGVSIPGAGTHNLLIVVSEHDTAYAFDADTGAVIWQVSALKSGESPSDDRGCGQVTPEIGITSTPTIDRTRGLHGAIYLVAMSKDSSGNYFQRLHALDLTTGAELFSGPVTITATYPGSGANSSGGFVIFDPKQYKERAGLLLLNGIVYTAWASHCDNGPYTGWVMGYNANTLAQTTVLNVVPNGNEGAIWMAGAGLAADSGNNIYFLDANGNFDTTLNSNGFPANGDYGNAFLKLSTSGGLAVADYFEMDNTVSESGSDTDLGSGGALLVPDQNDGTGHTWHLAVGAGKDTNLYLVNRDAMGKFNAGNNNNIYQELPGSLPGGIWSMPAYFNNRIFYGPVGNPILAFQFTNAKLSANPVAQTANNFGYPGATPSISANGSSNGIVWAAENSSPATLHAYDASDLHELYNSNQAAGGRDHFGNGNKFVTPMIANGKVYVGTTNSVGVFGLLTGQVATPTFAPRAGLYKLPVKVAITDSNSKAKIYYTTNGSTPTVSSTLYTGRIALNATTTLRAIAVVGGSSSAVATGTFTFQVAAPQFSPNPGRFSSPQSVTIKEFTPGATIHYTTDGSVPTSSSPVYNGPISVNSTTTIQAIGIETGYNSSVVSKARYIIGP